MAAPGEVTTIQNNVPYLDVSATLHGDEIVICVVNRHKDQAVTTDIISQSGSFSGVMKVYKVNGPDIKTMNDFNSEIVKTVEKPDVQLKGDIVTYSFAPHSFTMLRCSVKK